MRETVSLFHLFHHKLTSHKYTSGYVFFSELPNADVLIHPYSQPRGALAPRQHLGGPLTPGSEHHWVGCNMLQRPHFFAP